MGALWSCTPRAKVRRGRGCEGERCARFGGAHALLPPSPGTPHQPATTPAASILPLWNSVALFAVAPGRSFHAIQEVAERARHKELEKELARARRAAAALEEERRAAEAAAAEAELRERMQAKYDRLEEQKRARREAERREAAARQVRARRGQLAWSVCGMRSEWDAV